MKPAFDIIDFHTHPFLDADTNICAHKTYCHMTVESTLRTMEELSISAFAGCVIHAKPGIPEGVNAWDIVRFCNDAALQLHEVYGNRFIPGFHVHPAYIRESCEEIERMSRRGVKLVGELVPYFHGWSDYSTPELSEILDVCEQYGMIVSIHSQGNDEMDKMVQNHKNLTIVAAHPGEYGDFSRHMARMKMSDNYYIDLSGYGMFRHGMLRHAIDECGVEKILFGSDYPTCNPAMYVGGVYFDSLITDAEKEQIFSGNARRLLQLS